MRYRKKPVIVEACRYLGLCEFAGGFVPVWIEEAIKMDTIRYTPPSAALIIQTLEGAMEARPGDYIIQGIAGELYPCKPEIFEASYEPIEEERNA